VNDLYNANFWFFNNQDAFAAGSLGVRKQ